MDKSSIDWGFMEEREASVFLETVAKELSSIAGLFDMAVVSRMLNETATEIRLQRNTRTVTAKKPKKMVCPT